ncbi:hypothetical protein [Amycolatopsis sp. H20-H5]|uniref:hypothetical protein n=1 Tax=Amycolatopsis sp. H20-H5 TaxID=3046309 RepID=UPI002DBA12AF|nr:hypothetical protein [Amycolatopsis sp. H20-H5]MEC3977560.1 hypothetical protein [Amycolatopsis sp. H20-H5]
MSSRTRLIIVLVAALLLGGVSGLYLRMSAHDASGAPGPGGPLTLRATDSLLVRDTADGPGYGHLTQVAGNGTGERTVGEQSCARVYAAAGTGICLRPSVEEIGGYEIAVLDGGGAVRRTIPMNGVPSRARVSPSGRFLSWTTFVTGDSYAGTGTFSTRSGILDLRDNVLAGTLETFAVTMDGKPYQGQDTNFWGITFTGDDNRFYATMSTQGKRYLVEGDFAARRVRTLRDNVECPSLSPDGTRLVFKKRVSDDPARMWRFAVLDLATLRETPLAESRSVDDQGAWLNDDTVMYGVPREDRRHADVWSVPADGTGTPHLLVADAESPAKLG